MKYLIFGGKVTGNDEKIYDLLEKVYLELQYTNRELQNTNKELQDTKVELKTDIANVRKELKGDIADKRKELKGDITKFGTKIEIKISDKIRGLYDSWEVVNSKLDNMASDIKEMKESIINLEMITASNWKDLVKLKSAK